MLANYPHTVVHSFLVSHNIFLPLGSVRAQPTQEQPVLILGWWMSSQLVDVKALPSMCGEVAGVTLEHFAEVCPERSDAVGLESAGLTNIQACSVPFHVIGQILFEKCLKLASVAL